MVEKKKGTKKKTCSKKVTKCDTPTRARAKSTKREPTEQERTKLAKAAMLEALKASLGIVTTAAKKVGITRKTHHEWMNEDEEYAEAVRSIGDDALDFAESKLFQVMSGDFYVEKIDAKGNRTIAKSTPDVRAIMFYLETRGKGRGFSKRTELTGADGAELQGGQGAVIVLPSNDRENHTSLDDQYLAYLKKGGTPYPGIPLPPGYKPPKEKQGEKTENKSPQKKAKPIIIKG